MSRAAAILLVLAGVGVYAGGMNTPFMFDDRPAIETNRSIRTLWPLTVPLSPPDDTPVAARPLVNLSFAVNFAIHGTAVSGYHVGNLAIHLLVALVMFVLVRDTLARTLLPPSPKKVRGAKNVKLPPVVSEETLADALSRDATWVAWAVAIVWLLHPMNSEVVQYVTQRTEALMALCFLLTLYFASRAARVTRRGRWELAAMMACAAGMFSKESMVTAPVVVMLYDRAFLFPTFRAAWNARARLYVGLAATWLIVGAAVTSGARTSVGFSADTSAWVYLLNQAQMVTRYLWLAIWPRELVLDYGLPRALTLSDVLAPAALIVLLVVGAGYALFRWPRIGFAAALVFITLAPTSSIVPIATEVGAERRMYLPLIGLVLLIVLAVYRVAWQRLGPSRAGMVTAGIAACLASAAAIGTYVRTQEYASKLAMAETIVERWPNGRGRYLLGSELALAGRQREAVPVLREAVREYPPAYHALGVELVAMGQYEDATFALREFIRLNPGNGAVLPARQLLGQVLVERGDLRAAITEFERILVDAPNNATALRYLRALRGRLPG